MGVKIRDIIEKQTITLDKLRHKTLVIDAFNLIYQFISTIRQPDGSYLRDDAGITSHLTGIIYRISNLLSKGIKLILVFETDNPKLKQTTQIERINRKIEAKKKYEKAKEENNFENMKKYAMQSTTLTKEMIEESKELLTALGCAVIEINYEGEALASEIVKQGIAWAVVSQDYDALLFGAKRVVRNLSISQRKKQNNVYKKIDIELIELDKVLKRNNLSQDQLIILSILIGTDFNSGGIPGIGVKKALKLIKEYGTNYDALFYDLEWKKYYGYSWKEVFNIFKKEFDIPKIEFPKYNREKVIDLLCNKHSFSKQRVENTLNNLENSELNQSSLTNWFK